MLNGCEQWLRSDCLSFLKGKLSEEELAKSSIYELRSLCKQIKQGGIQKTRVTTFIQ